MNLLMKRSASSPRHPCRLTTPGQDCRNSGRSRAALWRSGHHVFRDDFRHDQPLRAASTNLEFSVEGLNIVLVDDVLFTGWTIRAAMDALLAHGRPTTVELAVLVVAGSKGCPSNRNTWDVVDSLDSQRVKVIWSKRIRRGPGRTH